MEEIDVSKCINNVDTFCNICTKETTGQFCSDNPNCYYKQLKRKEKEYERLKSELRSKVEFIQEQREIINQQNKEIELYKQCQGKRASKRENDLKKECEELKKQVEDWSNSAGTDTITCKKIKQVLQEIKEIVNQQRADIRVLYNRNTAIRMKFILQKISEVENEKIVVIKSNNDILSLWTMQAFIKEVNSAFYDENLKQGDFDEVHIEDAIKYYQSISDDVEIELKDVENEK